jgi:ubiquinol-cytochrome c reductase iron-sulfur subunit
MADHNGGQSGSTDAGTAVEPSVPRTVSSGTAVVVHDGIPNPGHQPHRLRVTDLDPAKEKEASRRVSGLFFLSLIGSVAAIVFYFVFPIDPTDFATVRISNLSLGLALSLGLLGIGIGAVHWAKSLMSDAEITEERHGTRGSDATRAKAVEVFTLGNKESGFGRRTLVRNSLIAAVAIFPLPAVVLFRDLAPAEEPGELLRHTMWDKGVRLTRDPSGTPIKASDVTYGSAFHVIPDGLNDTEDRLEQKAKAAVLLMRLRPEDLIEPDDKKDWSYQGIVAYSKICTHVGCPVALYEQQTHNLLCPCHQSQFDVSDQAKVIFGPASRPLPQLPIAIDKDGYLIAQSDFTEPVGPSFWEREL